MTAVLAIVCDDDSVVLGGDSACSGKRYVDIDARPKVHKLSDRLAVGVSGALDAEAAFMSVMRAFAARDDLSEDVILYELPKLFAEACDAHNVDVSDFGDYLIAFGGAVYVFEGVGCYRCGREVACVGSGGGIASGAAHALLRSEVRLDRNDAGRCIRCALEIAADLSPFVRGPFTAVAVTK